jgi:hypothetical protein
VRLTIEFTASTNYFCTVSKVRRTVPCTRKMTADISGRGFLGLSQKRHLAHSISEPSAISSFEEEIGDENERISLTDWPTSNVSDKLTQFVSEYEM